MHDEKRKGKKFIIEASNFDEFRIFSFSDEAVRSTRLIEADNDRLQEYATPDPNPYFDTTRVSNVTGLVGKTIQLVCKVKNLGNRTVSNSFVY